MSSERLSRRGEGGSSASETDNRKQSLYFPGNMLQEMKEEAARLDRSLSWVVQRAWKLAKGEIAQIPSMGDTDGEVGAAEAPEGDGLAD